jgi:hypothetical protein
MSLWMQSNWSLTVESTSAISPSMETMSLGSLVFPRVTTLSLDQYDSTFVTGVHKADPIPGQCQPLHPYFCPQERWWGDDWYLSRVRMRDPRLLDRQERCILRTVHHFLWARCRRCSYRMALLLRGFGRAFRDSLLRILCLVPTTKWWYSSLHIWIWLSIVQYEWDQRRASTTAVPAAWSKGSVTRFQDQLNIFQPCPCAGAAEGSI